MSLVTQGFLMRSTKSSSPRESQEFDTGTPDWQNSHRREDAFLEIHMGQTKTLKCQNESTQTHVVGEKEFLTQLAAVWNPFQRQGLEVRFKMGELLNAKLGPPKARQTHGMGTIKRISSKLKIDKSDISRLRRFAAAADSLEKFCKKHRKVTCWTDVRKLLRVTDDESSPPNDSRVSFGVLRSAKSMVQAFQRKDYKFKGSPSDDELVEVFGELFRLAKAKLNLTFED